MSQTRALRLVPIAFFLAAMSGVHAAPPQPQGKSSNYSQERAVCDSITSPESKAACIREAGAAQQASRSGQLSSRDSSSYEQNAIQRCSSFRDPNEQADCVSRVKTDTPSGSVSGGGVLRETETTVPVR
ncbi:MAG: hypothetical protein EOP24_29090 [Hyphomicrobiales bacterium]|nr:MAG: hypothetical protein EOP24_29090 [Hyphomicrobiales bacterium]